MHFFTVKIFDYFQAVIVPTPVYKNEITFEEHWLSYEAEFWFQHLNSLELTIVSLLGPSATVALWLGAL